MVRYGVYTAIPACNPTPELGVLPILTPSMTYDPESKKLTKLTYLCFLAYNSKTIDQNGPMLIYFTVLCKHSYTVM